MYSPNLCRTIYLEQEQNIYGGGLITALSYIPVIAFYSMFYYYTAKFINYVNNANKEILNNEADNDEEFKKNYIYQFEDTNIKLLNDVCLETETQNEIKKKQEVIEKMLSTKTLERALVIYYIFIKKGNYKVITKNEETNEYTFKEYNSYLEFKKYEEAYKLIKPSIDTKFFIGEKEYNINESNFIMISWIYYSGLYEYLTINIGLKYKILKDMYNNNLLTSNLFLRYQFFLQENETLIEEIEKLDDEEVEDEDEDEEPQESEEPQELEESEESEESEEIKILYEKHNLCRNLEIINLEDTDLESVTYSDSEQDQDEETEETKEYENELEKINLDNELEEIILKDETPNDEEYKKFINYFENSSCEKYFEKYIKEIKNKIIS